MLRFFIIMSLAIPAVCLGDTLKVPDDYGTIQEAIDAASEGDLVQVAAGTYMENIDFMGKAITVTGVDGAGSTFIDGGALDSVVTFAFAEGNDSVLQGFTITNGFSEDGGGIFCDFFAEPTLRNLRVTANEAFSFGGGIYAKHGSPVIDACEVDDNSAWNGGGMACYYSEATLSDSRLHHNQSLGFAGGGLYCFNQSKPTLTNTMIYKNTAYNGGGIGFWSSDAVITNCVIQGNTVTYQGGGFFLYSQSLTDVTNTIFWDNNKQEIYAEAGSKATVTYSCVQGGYAGQGNITDNPQFVNANSGDFHIKSTSLCMDQGDNDAEALPEKDIDGDERIINDVVDMGVDEYSSFAVDVEEISIAAGGTATFSLSPGEQHKDRTYLILAGATGTSPGTPLPGGHTTLPLNWDAVTDFVLANMWLPSFKDFTGTVDIEGNATAQLILPASLPSNLSGVVMYFAYTLNMPFDFASNPVKFTFVD